MIEMLVTVEKPPLSMASATDIQVALVRPDDSVVEREARAAADDQLYLDLHPDDLSLPGKYLGQVSFRTEGAVSIYGPAFQLHVGSEGAP